MGIKFTEEELDDFLASGHTLILSTIRQSGEPLSTPVWYVYTDGAFYVSTPEKSAKVKHLKRDPRACCVVEAGKHWKEVRAVVANCNAEFIEDKSETARIGTLRDEKYADFRLPQSEMPKSSTKAYTTKFALVKLTPREGKIRSWDNRKIRR